jgi:hypothetical protein
MREEFLLRSERMNRKPHYIAGEPLEAGKPLLSQRRPGKARLFHEKGPGRQAFGYVTTRDFREDEVVEETELHATEDL